MCILCLLTATNIITMRTIGVTIKSVISEDMLVNFLRKLLCLYQSDGQE
jgi:hypothetical protein